LANLLLWLAQTDLFQAKWSAGIHEEWIEGRRKRYSIDVAVSEKRRAVMDEKFPDALVTDYEELIDSLRNDPKDRHVLAAAIKCGANAIVTTNLKHFPQAELAKYHMTAVHQDDFVLDQLGLTAGSSRIVATAIVAHKKSLHRSRTTWRQYLEAMALPGGGLQKSYTEVSSPEFKTLLRDVIRTGDWLPD
jgi:predicted nucleic acid-binding protein